MILLATILAASLQVNLDSAPAVRAASKSAPAASCNIRTVGYRFVGAPGQSFRYAGERFEIPAEGSIELLAERNKTTYTVSNRSFPLDVSPNDPFGIREVQLPTAAHLIAAELTKGESR